MVILKESWQSLKIPFNVIERATKNFESCIGRGGYGRVYKGVLKHTTVAVKRLFEQYGQGSKEFLMEIELLCDQKHSNLVSLIGYCDEGKEKIIVYEYAERGSLDKYLRHRATAHILTWPERLGICVDIARGLDHLHNHAGKHQTIIHRDMKSANILLDHNWVAKISDLGLSKLSLAGLDRSAVISHPCGTRCYCEPEYNNTGIVKKESDVYSFGLVLFEILCGRLCTTVGDDGILLSATLVKDYYHKKKLHEIIDPNLKKQMNSDSMNKFIEIAYGCLHNDRVKRHPIHFVLEELESLKLKFDESEVESSNDDDLESWSSKSSFTTLVTHRTNVGKIFDIFDLNRDGGLSRKELAAFLLATNSNIELGEEQTYVDEVFYAYDRYIDGRKGLTYHGLLKYYSDGHGDLDSHVLKLGSVLDLDNDNSSGWQRLERILQKLMDSKRVLACIAPLKMNEDDHGGSHLDNGFEALMLTLKPNNDDEAASMPVGSPATSITIKPTKNGSLLLGFFIALMLLTTAIFIKLSFMWFLLVMLSNVNAQKTSELWNRFRGLLRKRHKQPN